MRTMYVQRVQTPLCTLMEPCRQQGVATEGSSRQTRPVHLPMLTMLQTWHTRRSSKALRKYQGGQTNLLLHTASVHSDLSRSIACGPGLLADRITQAWSAASGVRCKQAVVQSLLVPFNDCYPRKPSVVKNSHFRTRPW